MLYVTLPSALYVAAGEN